MMNSSISTKRKHDQSSSASSKNSKHRHCAPTATTDNVRSTGSDAITKKLSVAPPDESKTEDMISPVVFLRHLLESSDGVKMPKQYVFRPPAEQDLASYDFDVVSAVRERDIAKLRDFKRQGRSLNASNRFGESLLHMACRRGDVETVRFLVEEAKVRVDVRDDFGRTPLHDCCWTATPQTQMMEILLQTQEARQLLLTPDVRGHTPFDYARIEHWKAWIVFLEDRKSLLKQDDAFQIVA